MSRDPIGGVIRNLLDLQRLANATSAEIRGIVGALFDELAAEIARIDPTAPSRERDRTLRLERLLGEVESLVGQSFKEIRKTLTQRLAATGVQQSFWAESLLHTTINSVAVAIRSGRVGLGLMRSIIENDPFEGAPLKDWVDGIQGSLTHKKLGAVRRQLQAGMAGNETLEQMIRRIRGRSNGQGGFVGGVLQTTTRQAEAIARTGVNFIANRGQVATYKANADILKGLEFVAVLDKRTTEICMALDGEILDAENPDPNKVPPRHWRCRSVTVPVVDWEGLGIEPPAEGKRASADGPVPSSTTYEDWLRVQPAADQDEILGPARADLFRRGKIDLKGLITGDQQVRTVSELMVTPKPKARPRASGPVSSRRLAAILAQEERAIADLKIEYAALVDPPSGDVLFRKTSGAAGFVKFTHEELTLAKDRVLTHNHPSSSSFSDADVGLAITWDLAEVRAVGTQYGHRLIRPPGGWEPLGSLVGRARRIEPEVRRYVANRRKRGVYATEAEAWMDHWHELWRRVFRGSGARYIRRKR